MEADDEFTVQSVEETDKEFAYQYEELGDGDYAVHTLCQMCNREVIGINHTPTMFTINLAYEVTGQLWMQRRICQECAYNFILRPDASSPVS